MTTVVAAAEFCRDFEAYQNQAQFGPIEVRGENAVKGYYLSAEDFARVGQILAAGRRSFHPSELPNPLLAAVGHARMDPDHDHLNELMIGD